MTKVFINRLKPEQKPTWSTDWNRDYTTFGNHIIFVCQGTGLY